MDVCAASAQPGPLLNSLPSITLGMVLDSFEENAVLAAPPAARREFRWFDTGDHRMQCPTGLRDGQVLYLCKSDQAPSVLESRPHSFVLAYHDGAALPAWHARHAERCAIVRRQDTFSYFLNTMQGLFMRFMVWENELDRVVMRKGTLQELLDADERFTGHDVVVRDAFGTVLAASPSHAGGPTASEEDEGHADASHAGRPTASPASHLVAAPILVSQTAFATIELACTGAASQGCADMLALLARRAGAICERLWKDQVRVVCPHYFFFAGLIEGTSPQDGSRARRLREMGVPSPAQFKLIAFDLDGHDASLLVEPVMQAASRLNGGACFCLPYHGKVLALCYAEEGDKQLSHKASQRDVARLLHEPFGLEGCASQIFENVEDLDLAYEQTLVASDLKELAHKERANLCEAAPALYPFEEFLIYYLIGQTEKNERFLQFAFSHTILQKIKAEDVARGTNHFELFWFYLYFERNATAVAEHLHLHRNTVLYRMGRIQERFDLDLSQQEVREKMLIDFKVFFLMENHLFMKQVFDDHHR